MFHNFIWLITIRIVLMLNLSMFIYMWFIYLSPIMMLAMYLTRDMSLGAIRHVISLDIIYLTSAI